MLLSFPCTLFCTRPSQAKKMKYFPRGIQQVNFIQHFAFQSCKSNEKMTRKVNREMFPFQTPSSGLIHPTVNAICQIHVRCSYCRTTNWIKLFDLSLQRRRAQVFARKDNNLSIFFSRSEGTYHLKFWHNFRMTRQHIELFASFFNRQVPTYNCICLNRAWRVHDVRITIVRSVAQFHK